MTNLSIAKIDKKDYVFVKDKYVRYKICNVRKFYPKVKQRENSGKTISVYDFGDCLSISRLNYSFTKNNGKTEFNKDRQSSVFKIKFKNGKINVYKILQGDTGKAIRNKSNSPEILDQDIFRLNPRKKDPPIYRKRLNKVLINFFKRHGIKFKYQNNYLDNLLISCYPGIQGFDLKDKSLNSIYSKYFRHGDIKYVIKKCFGLDGKKLVKLVCERITKDRNFDILILGKILKGKIPIDYFYKIIDVNLTEIAKFGSQGMKFKDIREFVKYYNAERLLKLFSGNINNFYFTDTIRLFPTWILADGNSARLPKKPKTWTEIHNIMSPVRNININRIPMYNQITDVDLPVQERHQKIDGAEFDNFKIEFPKHSKDLSNYSDIMSNCVRGYSHLILNAGCSLLGIYKNNELTYNISIYGNQIDQFLGKFNQPPESEDKNKVLDFLKNKGIIDYTLY